jgi:6-phosphogluconolactonase
MNNFELTKFSDDEKLAEAVGGEWLAQLRSNATQSVALSGGRIARRFFTAVAGSQEARQRLALVQFFWGDERCVPPSNSESNYAIAQELLLAPLQIPAANIHRLKGELPPDQAAREAEVELLSAIKARKGNQPVLDLIFLGMGEDGHVASLFPHEPNEMVRDASIYRAVTASKPPPRRITLGYQTIFAARDVWVLASGAGKEKALRDSIAPNGDTPLARVLQNRTRTKIFTDVQL